IGGNQYNPPKPPVPAPPAPVDLPPASEIGVRTFDEINATMAEITGVNPNEANVRATFETVRESLPAVPTLDSVLASHQVVIAQLAIEYCNAPIENVGLREELFDQLDFGAASATAFDGDNVDVMIDQLLERMFGGEELATQPDAGFIKTELGLMLHDGHDGRDGLLSTPIPPNQRPEERTQTLAKAVCSAVLGSAAMLVQ